MPHGGEDRIRTCFICSKEADYAHGSAYSLIWLCVKHDMELQKEEKKLKEMAGMQALTNIKKRFLEEKHQLGLWGQGAVV